MPAEPQPRRLHRPHRPSGAPWVVALVLGLAAGTASARPTGRLLDDAAARSDAGDYEGALAVLGEALTSPENTDRHLARIYWAIGENAVYLRREPAALDAFDRLLALDPAFEPPRVTPPRVRAAFETARTRLAESGPPTLRAEPPAEPRAASPLPFRLRATGLRRGDRAIVFHRTLLAESWSASAAAPAADGSLVATLPARPAGAIEWYAEIQDLDGFRRTGVGSPLAPETLRIPAGLAPATLAPAPAAPAPAPVWAEPWVWAVVGGVVAAGGVLTWVALQPQAGTVHLRVSVDPP